MGSSSSADQSASTNQNTNSNQLVARDRDEATCFERGTAPRKPLGRGLRILCLHGSGACNEVTRMQVCNIGLDQYARCDFLHGPVPAEPYSQAFVEFFEDDTKFWEWHAGFEEDTDFWEAVEPSLKRILRHMESKGPYDGLYGFSQGASMATLLSRPSVRRALGREGPCPWRFVICAMGADSISHRGLDSLIRAKGADDDEAKALLTLPSMHIIGRSDALRSWSSQLARLYEEGQGQKVVYDADVGHELPMSLGMDKNLSRKLHNFLVARASGDEKGLVKNVGGHGEVPVKF